ncbi:hypothetical protein FHS01_002324 [Longimicrobium terrae]|uniref:Uncharacterized protein n=1 Tax=Longimicrobium terrae TaxID=1639882 RepID=A0A841GY78_9BACT|nr:hypothetical protein [Longimicrobium terrae]MBB6070702.1 hypothetical protein [Longimicrobium terrae]
MKTNVFPTRQLRGKSRTPGAASPPGFLSTCTATARAGCRTGMNPPRTAGVLQRRYWQSHSETGSAEREISSDSLGLGSLNSLNLEVCPSGSGQQRKDQQHRIPQPSLLLLCYREYSCRLWNRFRGPVPRNRSFMYFSPQAKSAISYTRGKFHDKHTVAGRLELPASRRRSTYSHSESTQLTTVDAECTRIGDRIYSQQKNKCIPQRAMVLSRAGAEIWPLPRNESQPVDFTRLPEYRIGAAASACQTERYTDHSHCSKKIHHHGLRNSGTEISNIAEPLATLA